MDVSNNVFPKSPVFGQSYVPIQYLNKTFSPFEGLENGSIFPELVFPYYPNQSVEENLIIKQMNESRKEFNDD